MMIRAEELNAAPDSQKLDLLYDLLKNDKTNLVVMKQFLQLIINSGLKRTDPRLAFLFTKLDEHAHMKAASEQSLHDDSTIDGLLLSKEDFIDCIHESCEIVFQALEGEFIIPEFQPFVAKIKNIFDDCKLVTSGKVADYIPQLARMNPNYWGVSVCTVDGQRFSIGDTKIPFCLQSSSKPLNYALAQNDLTAEEVHAHVGQEPSGRSFNELSLDYNKKPHNPMINAGAIATVSLLKTSWKMADRFDYVSNEYKRMAGGEFVGFSNSTFLSERDTADRNFALGYYMQENKVFPDNAKLQETLDLYFQLCSVEVNCESGSVIAATLASGGICPTTGEQVLSSEAVRNTLSLMHSCGMYDYSGQFAFKVGLPAKSGVSGVILLVVPNVMGICIWSPPLDELGNSVKGIRFCEDLVKVFSFHNYDCLRNTNKKYDPRRREVQHQSNQVVALLFSAANGDVSAIRRFYLQGMDVSQSDYDGRTALHLAAAEGHVEVAKFLLEKCRVNPTPKDRWNFTPLDDAVSSSTLFKLYFFFIFFFLLKIKFKRNNVVDFLKQFGTPSTPVRKEKIPSSPTEKIPWSPTPLMESKIKKFAPTTPVPVAAPESK